VDTLIAGGLIGTRLFACHRFAADRLFHQRLCTIAADARAVTVTLAGCDGEQNSNINTK
jgi:hypothetical protein